MSELLSPRGVTSPRGRGAGDDESWVRVQKQVYTNWVKHHLKDAKIPFEDLETDFSDGVSLCALLVALSGKPVRYNANPKSYAQKLDNLTQAVQFMADEGVNFKGFGAEDLASSRSPRVAYALCWALLRHYQVQDSGTAGGDELLSWCNNKLRPFQLHQVSFEPEHWRDGVALACLVASLVPGEISINALPSTRGEPNVREAFEVAERKLGVPQLMNPRDVSSGMCDDRALKTWISFLPMVERRRGGGGGAGGAAAAGSGDSTSTSASASASAAGAGGAGDVNKRQAVAGSAALNQHLRELKRQLCGLTDPRKQQPKPAANIPPTLEYATYQTDRMHEEIARVRDYVTRLQAAKDEADFERQMDAEKLLLISCELEQLQDAKGDATPAASFRRSLPPRSAAALSEELNALRKQNPALDEQLRRADATQAELERVRKALHEKSAELERLRGARDGDSGTKQLRLRVGELEREKADLETRLDAYQRGREVAGTGSATAVNTLRAEVDSLKDELLHSKNELEQERRRALATAAAGGHSTMALEAMQSMRQRIEELTKDLRDAKIEIERERKGELTTRVQILEKELERETRKRLEVERERDDAQKELKTTQTKLKDEMEASLAAAQQRAMKLEEQKLHLKDTVRKLRDEIHHIATDGENKLASDYAKMVAESEHLRADNERIKEQLLAYAHEIREYKEQKLMGPDHMPLERFPNERELMKKLYKLQKYRTVYKRAMAYRYELEKELDEDRQELAAIARGDDEAAAAAAAQITRRRRRSGHNRLHDRFEGDYARWKHSPEGQAATAAAASEGDPSNDTQRQLPFLPPLGEAGAMRSEVAPPPGYLPISAPPPLHPQAFVLPSTLPFSDPGRAPQPARKGLRLALAL